MNDTRQALSEFTARYCQCWQQARGHGPQSQDLYGIPSPCLERTGDECVYWQPKPMAEGVDLAGVERALDIIVRPEIQAFFSTQYAGDMAARFGQHNLTLLQVWSEEDFQRVQENLIGHLVMQKRLKQSPTLFIATTDDEMEIIAVSNLTGEVVREKLGTTSREMLAPTLAAFLISLDPVVTD